MTKDEIFLTLYEDIKKQFWIQKNDFIDFLAKNKSFLIWIHTVLDTYKKTREEGGNQGKVLQSLGI